MKEMVVKHCINISRVPMGQQDRLWALVVRRIVRFLRKNKHPDVEHARLHLVIYPDDRRPGAWMARVRVRITSDLLSMQAGPCHDPQAVLGNAFDGLEVRVREHLRSRQTSRQARRRLRTCTDRRQQRAAFLQDLEDCGRLLCSHMALLRRLAGQELEAIEEEGEPTCCGLNTEDVINEALLRAWDRYDPRAAGGYEERWLEGIIRTIVREEIADREICMSTACPGEQEVAVEEEYDPRRDVDGWCEGDRDPRGLALWEDPDADDSTPRALSRRSIREAA
jgi:hypothetical protein